jgi:uncharacterized membrane protein
MAQLLFKRETLAPIAALMAASGVCVGLVGARIAWTGNPRYTYLIWNLFLAWVPLAFALLAGEQHRHGWRRNWRLGALAGAWLLFFPNAPYICTDVIHLFHGTYRQFWVDLSLVLLTAVTGLVLGFVSLYLMQSLVRRSFGPVAGWGFVAGVAGLAGFGIYLGRFLRFNSWDVIAQPVRLFQGVSAWAADPMANSLAFAFPLLFATFLFFAYIMLYALTHLPQLHALPVESAPLN